MGANRQFLLQQLAKNGLELEHGANGVAHFVRLSVEPLMQGTEEAGIRGVGLGRELLGARVGNVIGHERRIVDHLDDIGGVVDDQGLARIEAAGTPARLGS
jgi:hypothetical protein